MPINVYQSHLYQNLRNSDMLLFIHVSKIHVGGGTIVTISKITFVVSKEE